MTAAQKEGPAGTGRFAGKNVLVTGATVYMGPAITAAFRKEGAQVIADAGTYVDDPDEPARIVAAAGQIDILVINLFPAPSFDGFTFELAADATDAEWHKMFNALVHPTMRFTRAVLPQMIERRAGKIIAVTSAVPLRALSSCSSYTAARGAQNAYVMAAGAEVAQHNVQINAIGQNFVYGGYPPDAMDRPAMREAVMRDVPARRLSEGWEQAELVMFLASDRSNFICGQTIAYAGGWVT